MNCALDILSGVFESEQCSSIISCPRVSNACAPLTAWSSRDQDRDHHAPSLIHTQVLSRSGESFCAMHCAELVTKLPPLLHRHWFIWAEVSPVQSLLLEASLRHDCVPEG